ncbi:MAG: M14 family metallopeptidase [Tumebacillaceae bacterium]
MKKNKIKQTAVGIALSMAMLAGTAAMLPAPSAQAANSVTLYRIYTDSTHTELQLEDQGFDVWDTQPNFVEAMATSAQLEWLQTNGWSYTMSRQANGPSFDSSYRTYASVRQVLADRANRFKDLATLITIGNSFEGQPIQLLKITNKKTAASKPKSLWIGGTHAREIAPPEVMLSNVDYLLNGYGVDPDVTWMLDNREVYILPVMNPDGHVKTEQLLNWRKNTDTRYSPNGIDLNRNYDEIFAGIWGNPVYGASQNPLSEIYSGPYAFSEPETAAVRNLIEGVMGTTGTPQTVANGFNMIVDMHTYGNLIMYPWNWTKDITQGNAQGDIDKMRLITEKWATYNNYKSEIGSKLYATSGDTTDWAYGFHKIPAFTIEIGKEFWTNNEQLPGLIAENRGPFLHGVKVQDDPFGRIGGPDALSLTASAANGTITLNGYADDTKNGSNKVKAVEVFVDKLGARGTGVKGQLGSSTNAGAISSFTATLSAAGLTSGKHLLIVEAQDDLGQWGAPSAVWVTLP